MPGGRCSPVPMGNLVPGVPCPGADRYSLARGGAVIPVPGGHTVLWGSAQSGPGELGPGGATFPGGGCVGAARTGGSDSEELGVDVTGSGELRSQGGRCSLVRGRVAAARGGFSVPGGVAAARGVLCPGRGRCSPSRSAPGGSVLPDRPGPAPAGRARSHALGAGLRGYKGRRGGRGPSSELGLASGGEFGPDSCDPLVLGSPSLVGADPRWVWGVLTPLTAPFPPSPAMATSEPGTAQPKAEEQQVRGEKGFGVGGVQAVPAWGQDFALLSRPWVRLESPRCTPYLRVLEIRGAPHPL